MLLILDTETGGLDETSCALLEIGAVLTDLDLKIISSFQSYIYPPPHLQILDAALAATGFDLEKCMTAPPESEVIHKFVKWVKSHTPASEYPWTVDNRPRFGGFNSPFDLKFMWEALMRNGYISAPYQVDKKSGAFDIYRQAKKKWPVMPPRFDPRTGKNHTHRLVDICHHMDLPFGAHNALDDALATIEVGKLLRAN